MWLWGTAVILGVACWLYFRDDGAGSVEPRSVAIALISALPFLTLVAVLLSSPNPLGFHSFEYWGKRLQIGPDRPVTLGGTAGFRSAEDLWAPTLNAERARIVMEESADGKGPLFLELLSVRSPVFSVNGAPLNAFLLKDGDVIDVDGCEQNARFAAGWLTDRLQAGADNTVELPSAMRSAITGVRPVITLAEAIRDCTALSFVFRPTAASPWHLLIRDTEVRLRRPDDSGQLQLAASRVDRFELPPRSHLVTQVVRGKSLDTLRSDDLFRSGDQLEVRFRRPQRRVVSSGGMPSRNVDSGVRLMLTTPGNFDEHDMITFAERSDRFRSLKLGFDHDDRDTFTLRVFGQDIDRAFGQLLALGDPDQMLVRIDRVGIPWRLLFQGLLISLFIWVFLGRPSRVDHGVAFLTAAVGILVALRLAFSYRSSIRPPGFDHDAYLTAEVTSWLAPALLVAGRTLALLFCTSNTRKLRPALHSALLGLGVALVGMLASVYQSSKFAGLALLPLSVAALLVGMWWLLAAAPRELAQWWSHKHALVLIAGSLSVGLIVLLLVGYSLPAIGIGALGTLSGLALLLIGWAIPERRFQRIVEKIRSDGLDVPFGWIALGILALLVVRGLGVLVGMKEAMMLGGVRLSWSIIQLPACAVLFAAILARLQKLLWEEKVEPRRTWAPSLAVIAFLGLGCFVVISFATDDRGLAIVHAPFLAVAMLLSVEPAYRALRRRPALSHAVGLLGLVAPIFLVVLVHAFPLQTVAPALNQAAQFKQWLKGVDSSGTQVSSTDATPRSDPLVDQARSHGSEMFRLFAAANPERLRRIGLARSDSLALQFDMLKSYAAQGGWFGTGYLSGELPGVLGKTYLNDLVPMVFVLPEFGKLGLVFLMLVYLLPVLALWPAGGGIVRSELGRQGMLLAATSVLAFTVPSAIMILANLNLVLFSGKNCYLLGLNSLSDAVESSMLLALAVVGITLKQGRP